MARGPLKVVALRREPAKLNVLPNARFSVLDAQGGNELDVYDAETAGSIINVPLCDVNGEFFGWVEQGIVWISVEGGAEFPVNVT